MSHAASIRRSDWQALLDLERKADELRRQADAKNRELHALWNEFNGLTDKADESNPHIASINNELASLEPAALEAQVKDLYGKLLRGWTG
jgi:predicted  nucleic acid-binding Zn-ribbon protein